MQRNNLGSLEQRLEADDASPFSKEFAEYA